VVDIGDKSYAWVITKTTADWTDIPASSKTLNDQVAMLRQSLTFTADKPFDAALAYRIYRETLEPIANRIADKKRISVITNGALTAIPLKLLVTKDPASKALKDLDWLPTSTSTMPCARCCGIWSRSSTSCPGLSGQSTG
jgi:CHAT domain-containing protein